MVGSRLSLKSAWCSEKVSCCGPYSWGGRLQMGIAHNDTSFSFNQPSQSAEGPVCVGSPAESVEGCLERLQPAIVSKPELWLQPETAPVSTWPCRGPSLAANDCLAFHALSCHRPSPGRNVLRKQYLSTEGALLLDSQLQLQPGCFAMSPGRASIPGR